MRTCCFFSMDVSAIHFWGWCWLYAELELPTLTTHVQWPGTEVAIGFHWCFDAMEIVDIPHLVFSYHSPHMNRAQLASASLFADCWIFDLQLEMSSQDSWGLNVAKLLSLCACPDVIWFSSSRICETMHCSSHEATSLACTFCCCCGCWNCDLQSEMHSHERWFLNVAKLHLHVLIAFGFSSGICENKENVTMCCTSHWATSLLCAFCGCCGCCK